MIVNIDIIMNLTFSVLNKNEILKINIYLIIVLDIFQNSNREKRKVGMRYDKIKQSLIFGNIRNLGAENFSCQY